MARSSGNAPARATSPGPSSPGSPPVRRRLLCPGETGWWPRSGCAAHEAIPSPRGRRVRRGGATGGRTYRQGRSSRTGIPGGSDSCTASPFPTWRRRRGSPGWRAISSPSACGTSRSTGHYEFGANLRPIDFGGWLGAPSPGKRAATAPTSRQGRPEAHSARPYGELLAAVLAGGLRARIGYYRRGQHRRQRRVSQLRRALRGACAEPAPYRRSVPCFECDNCVIYCPQDASRRICRGGAPTAAR